MERRNGCSAPSGAAEIRKRQSQYLAWHKKETQKAGRKRERRHKNEHLYGGRFGLLISYGWVMYPLCYVLGCRNIGGNASCSFGSRTRVGVFIMAFFLLLYRK